MGNYWSSYKEGTYSVQDDQVPCVFQAVKKGNERLLNYYCKNEMSGQDLTKLRYKGQSLLHYAVSHGQLEIVKFLLKSLNFDANFTDEMNNTPLIELLVNGKFDHGNLEEIFELLLKYKADINARTYVNRTILLKSLISGKYNISKLLLKHGADPNIGDEDGLRPIHVCATYAQINLLETLISCGADVDSRKNDGGTALCYAILGGHEDMFNILIKKGCNLNNGFKFGLPLQTAIYKCQLNFVETLLKNGVAVNAELHEFHMMYSQMYDYLNFALHVFYIKYDNYRKKNIHYGDHKMLDQCISSLQILNLISQAACSHQNFSKNAFFRPGWLPLKIPEFQPYADTLQQIVTRLDFVHEITYHSKLQTQLPVVEANVNKCSLKWTCIMEIRQLICGSSNMIHAVEKMELPKILKDDLLLKNL
ncbi:hypothetical protein ACF0H5_020776 [Mactra antiquata]